MSLFIEKRVKEGALLHVKRALEGNKSAVLKI